jgi:hypothetical protein
LFRGYVHLLRQRRLLFPKDQAPVAPVPGAKDFDACRKGLAALDILHGSHASPDFLKPPLGDAPGHD